MQYIAMALIKMSALDFKKNESTHTYIHMFINIHILTSAFNQ